MARALSALGIAGAVVYGIVWVGVAAAQGSRNTDSYVYLGLLTLPLVAVSAGGWIWARHKPALGGLLLTVGGLLMAGWGLFIAVDVGPGWLLSGLAVLAGGVAALRRRPSAA